MWQCASCKEKCLEKPSNHLCVTDNLNKYFKGRKAILEPLFRSLVHKLERVGGVELDSKDNFIVLKMVKPFALIRITADHLEVLFNLPNNAPISPDLNPLRLQIGGMKYYADIRSISDITPTLLKNLYWSIDTKVRQK